MNDRETDAKSLAEAIARLQEQLALPLRLHDHGIAKQEYLARVEGMAEQAFENHCTATNPRLPLIQEIIDIYIAIY